MIVDVTNSIQGLKRLRQGILRAEETAEKIGNRKNNQRINSANPKSDCSQEEERSGGEKINTETIQETHHFGLPQF